MANFDSEILNPEEQAGFNPGMDGDETFSLEKTGEYQGVMPDFNFDGELADEETDINPVLESAFQDSPDYQNAEQTENSTSVDDTSISEVPGLPEDSAVEESEVQVEADYPVNDVAPAPLEELAELPVENDSSEVEEPLRIDDDLKALLTSDLQSRKSKLESKKAKKEEEAPPPVKEEFPTFDDEGDTQIIDLSELEADRPSTYNSEESFPKPEEEPKDENLAGMQISKHKKKPAVKPDETGEVKEPKRKKPLPIFPIAIAGIAAVFLISVGVALYLFLFQPGKMFDFEKKKTEIAKVKSKDKPKKAAKPIVKQEAKPEVKADSMPAPAAKETESVKKQDTVKTKKIVIADKVPAEKVAKTPEKKVEPPIVDKQQPMVKVPLPLKDTEKKPKVAEKPPVVKKEEPKKPEPVKIDKPAAKEPTKKASEELYTIQIYSSPNLEDAQEWLTDLKSKNVNGASISEQKIRDKTWYRVRFGAYKTRQEAGDVAAKLGYAQSWVDRIK
jgi:septal ring-binding cell division protein DamX